MIMMILMISMLCDGATWSNSCEKIWQGRCQTKWWTCNVQNQFWKQKIISGQLDFLKIIFWFIIVLFWSSLFGLKVSRVKDQKEKKLGHSKVQVRLGSIRTEGGTHKQANSIWWKEICGTVSNISQYIAISRQQYPDLVNMSKVQTRLGALDGIGQICGELLPWMLWLSARPPRPPLDP